MKPSIRRPKILLIAPHINIVEPFRAALEKNGFAATVTDLSPSPSGLPCTEQFALVVTLGQNGRHATGDDAIDSRLIDATFLSPNRAFPGSIQLFRNGIYRLDADQVEVDKFVDTVRELCGEQITSWYSDQSKRSGDPDPAGQRATSRSVAEIPTLACAGQARRDNQPLDLIGQSPQIEEVRQLIKCYSQFPGASVLITGETGAGKEVVANLLHAFSPRVGKPFIPVNCGAISEALFESELFGHCKGAFTGAHAAKKGFVEEAQDGTLFLDEISTMTLSQQVKLLRLLENHTYRRVGETLERRSNAWIIAATNQNLEELVGKNLFRRDLYYRLKAVEIKLPPLRERREDVALLSKKFLEQFVSQYGVGTKLLSELAEKALLRHNWPGNVRELKQLMLTLTISVKSDMILPQHLPMEFGKMKNASTNEEVEIASLDDMEKAHIMLALQATNFNVSQSADLLQINRRTLQRKLKQHNIEVAGFRSN